MESTAARQAGGRRPRRRGLLAAAAAALAAIAAIIAVLALSQPASSGSGLPRARAFSLPALGQAGHRVSLAAYAGRPVVINFFASWCGPCQRETPLLAAFYRRHHGAVAVIGVDSNDQQAPAQRFLARAGVRYPVGFDAYPAATAASYGIVALPQTFFLNARHQIVRHVSGALTPADLDAWAAAVAKSRAG